MPFWKCAPSSAPTTLQNSVYEPGASAKLALQFLPGPNASSSPITASAGNLSSSTLPLASVGNALDATPFTTMISCGWVPLFVPSSSTVPALAAVGFSSILKSESAAFTSVVEPPADPLAGAGGTQAPAPASWSPAMPDSLAGAPPALTVNAPVGFFV